MYSHIFIISMKILYENICAIVIICILKSDFCKSRIALSHMMFTTPLADNFSFLKCFKQFILPKAKVLFAFVF